MPEEPLGHDSVQKVLSPQGNRIRTEYVAMVPNSAVPCGENVLVRSVRALPEAEYQAIMGGFRPTAAQMRLPWLSPYRPLTCSELAAIVSSKRGNSHVKKTNFNGKASPYPLSR